MTMRDLIRAWVYGSLALAAIGFYGLAGYIETLGY